MDVEVEPYILQLETGHMRYNHKRDTWSLWIDQKGKLEEISANKFTTIHEFKAWPRGRLNE